jgi:ABC-type nitrate/sulfonate/bicarbonate transport system substrate-binding protein
MQVSLIGRRKRRFGTRLAAGLLLLFALAPPPHPAHALDQVSLQLKWKHQFQFAGYYAALEKGFYREHGLEVEIREGGPGMDAGTEVAHGAAEFGVCTTSVLTNSIERANNVVIGVIFQHSAAIV